MFNNLLDMGTGIDIYANEVVGDSETLPANKYKSTSTKSSTSIIGTNATSSEKDLQATQVIETLNALGLSTDRLFTVGRKQDLIGRSKLKVLGPWMNQVIRHHFQQRNPEVVYRLLGRISDLLQLSRAGCKGFACSAPVLSIHSKYQDLMYNASRTRYFTLK